MCQSVHGVVCWLCGCFYTQYVEHLSVDGGD